MSVIHTIRKDGKENFKTVRLTPLKAIRAFCLECVCWNPHEVDRCTAPFCPLFPFRTGDPSAPKPSIALRNAAKRVAFKSKNQQTTLH